jgi:hypothetical protein
MSYLRTICYSIGLLSLIIVLGFLAFLVWLSTIPVIDTVSTKFM